MRERLYEGCGISIPMQQKIIELKTFEEGSERYLKVLKAVKCLNQQGLSAEDMRKLLFYKADTGYKRKIPLWVLKSILDGLNAEKNGKAPDCGLLF